MKKTLIFDFDGTIADSFDAFVKICEDSIRKYRFSKININFREELRNRKLKEIFNDLHISSWQLPFLVLIIRSGLKKEINKIKSYSNIKETLEKLKEKNFNLGILSSNSQKNISTFLKNNDLENLFDFVYSEISLFGKEKSFDKILRKFKLSKNEVIYIGDETRDIEACKKFGIPIVSVSWGFNSKELLQEFKPDFLIDEVKELANLI